MVDNQIFDKARNTRFFCTQFLDYTQYLPPDIIDDKNRLAVVDFLRTQKLFFIFLQIEFALLTWLSFTAGFIYCME